LLVTCAPIFAQTENGEIKPFEYKITRFQHNPGLYYEKRGTLLRTDEKWKLVIKLDISALEKRINQANKFLKTTAKMCSDNDIHHNNRINCQNIYSGLQNKKQTLVSLFERIKVIMGFSTRKRRGLINGIGSVAKQLFGTMDADDEKTINDHINLIENKQLAEQHALKNHLKILNTTIAHLDEVESIIQSNEQTLAKSVSQIMASINRQTQENLLNEHLLAITNILQEIETDIRDIINLVTEKHNELTQLDFVPIERIIQSLRDTNSHLQNDLRFPFQITAENWVRIKEFVTIAVYCKGPNIFVVMQVPLVHSVEHGIYNVIPLPIYMRDNMFAIANIQNTLVAIDGNRQTYALLTKDQLTSCKNIRDHYVCDNVMTLYRIQTNSPCEIQAYVHELDNYLNCKTTHVTSNHTIWIQLQQVRTWLYSTLGEQSVFFQCEKRSDKTETLKGVGEVALSNQCGFSTRDIFVNTKTIIEHTQINTYLPRFNITIARTNDATLQNTHTLDKIELQNLTSSETQLQNIRNQIQKTDSDFDNEFYKQPYFVYPTSISGVLAVVIVSIVVYVIIRKNKVPRQQQHSQQVRFADTTNKLRSSRLQHRCKDYKPHTEHIATTLL